VTRPEKLHELPAVDFRRLLGVEPQTFAAMLAAYERWKQAKKKPGRPPALSLEEQLVLALEFWREYRTHYHLANDWQVDESTVRRTIERVENALIKSGAFRLPGRKAAAGTQIEWNVVVVDVTERPVERPKKSSVAVTAARRSATR
jgi:hypothetical protein